MAQRDILICGDPVLRKKARPIREIGQQVADLFAEMVEAMLEAEGLGLAAPQIGETLQAICVREDAEPECEILQLINPRLVAAEGEELGREGCLSLPTLYGKVLRPERVLVRGFGLDGDELEVEAEGIVARALLHEMDHLKGRLFIDQAEPDTLAWLVPDADEEDGVRWEDTTREEALAALERLRQRRRAGGDAR